MTLVRILKRYENADSEGITSNITNACGEEARGEDTRGEEPINGSVVYHNSLPMQNARGDENARSHDAPSTNNNNENTPSNDNRVLIGIVSKLSTTVQSLQQNVSGLTGKVNALLQARSNENTSRIVETPNVYVSAPVDTYNALQNTRTAPNAAAGSEEQLSNFGTSGNMVRTAHGYSAETLPFVETISPQLRKNIISGMDINLTSLLIPYYSGSGTYELNLSEDKNNKTDPRSSKSLSLGEFIQAFGIYKNIMCTTFPHRRSELDLYERDLVDIATRYPGKGFYEFHKRFSADAAAHLRHNNISVDWSIRNNTLFCNIFENIKPNTCNICSSSFHSTSFCNQSNNNNRNTTGLYRSDQDIHDRERSYHSGKEICNNFNGKTGITTLPSNSIECKNLKSALSQPAHVLKLIESEAEKGCLEGLFDFIPFEHYRINPIGVAEDGEVQSLGTTCQRDTNSLSASLRADDGLNLKIEELLDASISESNRLTYKSDFKCFRTFLVMNGRPCSEVNLPYVQEDLLVYFVTYCQKTLHLKHQTIKLYLAGVRHYYIRFLGYDPMANAIRLPIILRGIKKSQNNVVQERLPITSSILSKLCDLLSKGMFSPLLDLMFQCAFKMAFFGFLQYGEFTCRSYNDNSCTVLLQDITVDPTKLFFIFHL
ncbi:unnamed protein product [Mytilus coruscus]|uniref:Uncharacterized protein n=1 Tax=Mytilus coruscus TaxID=42192 RepID=A0A6J8ECC9_MYTCO|nr:unnamed protein product [Mytilus coruscus]